MMCFQRLIFIRGWLVLSCVYCVTFRCMVFTVYATLQESTQNVKIPKDSYKHDASGFGTTRITGSIRRLSDGWRDMMNNITNSRGSRRSRNSTSYSNSGDSAFNSILKRNSTGKYTSTVGGGVKTEDEERQWEYARSHTPYGVLYNSSYGSTYGSNPQNRYFGRNTRPGYNSQRQRTINTDSTEKKMPSGSLADGNKQINQIGGRNVGVNSLWSSNFLSSSRSNTNDRRSRSYSTPGTNLNSSRSRSPSSSVHDIPDNDPKTQEVNSLSWIKELLPSGRNQNNSSIKDDNQSMALSRLRSFYQRPNQETSSALSFSFGNQFPPRNSVESNIRSSLSNIDPLTEKQSDILGEAWSTPSSSRLSNTRLSTFRDSIVKDNERNIAGRLPGRQQFETPILDLIGRFIDGKPRIIDPIDFAPLLGERQGSAFNIQRSCANAGFGRVDIIARGAPCHVNKKPDCCGDLHCILGPVTKFIPEEYRIIEYNGFVCG